MEEGIVMKYQWPDLYFGPINLWTAPWLGRAYIEFVRNSTAPKQVVPEVPNARLEQITNLTKNR